MVVGTLASVATAMFGAACVSIAWKRILSKSGMHLVSGLLAVLALAAVYIASAVVLMYVAERQVNPPIAGLREFTIGYTFIHPGVLHKLAPAAAIVVTWLYLLRVKKPSQPSAHGA